MPVRQHEPVAIGPLGRARVVAHDARPEHVRERRQRHRGARVAVAGLLHCVHRQPAHHVDAALLDLRRSHDTPSRLRRVARGPRLNRATRASSVRFAARGTGSPGAARGRTRCAARGARSGVRDGRSSRTVTGSSATTSPARSARRMSSVSKRSAPVRHCRASGSTADCAASASCRACRTPTAPKPTRRIVAKPAVTARRGHGPGVAGARRPLRPDHDRAPLSDRAVVEAPRPVEELEVVVVDVEEHDGVARRR